MLQRNDKFLDNQYVTNNVGPYFPFFYYEYLSMTQVRTIIPLSSPFILV